VIADAGKSFGALSLLKPRKRLEQLSCRALYAIQFFFNCRVAFERGVSIVQPQEMSCLRNKDVDARLAILQSLVIKAFSDFGALRRRPWIHADI
jgi:hypothetical protein